MYHFTHLLCFVLIFCRRFWTHPEFFFRGLLIHPLVLNWLLLKWKLLLTKIFSYYTLLRFFRNKKDIQSIFNTNGCLSDVILSLIFSTWKFIYFSRLPGYTLENRLLMKNWGWFGLLNFWGNSKTPDFSGVLWLPLLGLNQRPCG